MKKKFSLIICICICILPLSSCSREYDAYSMLCEFVSAYGAEGTVYSPIVPEGEDGYIYEGLVERIYLFSGEFPENYAIFLNSHPDYSSECGIFVCSDAEMLSMVEEMCLERIGLLCGRAENAFLKKSGNLCFYSTMQDRVRAEKIFNEIIR